MGQVPFQSWTVGVRACNRMGMSICASCSIPRPGLLRRYRHKPGRQNHAYRARRPEHAGGPRQVLGRRRHAALSPPLPVTHHRLPPAATPHRLACHANRHENPGYARVLRHGRQRQLRFRAPARAGRGTAAPHPRIQNQLRRDMSRLVDHSPGSRGSENVVQRMRDTDCLSISSICLRSVRSSRGA